MVLDFRPQYNNYVKLLLEYGADVNVKYENDQTCLHSAIGNTENAKLLSVILLKNN